MSKQREAVSSNKTLNEIMDTVNELPLEYQNKVLAILRGMVFTKNCLIKKGLLQQSDTSNTTPS
ncbi:hypothetical protein ACIQXI_09410 [Lysinibacillus sp. NPDC097195]|uniref:hypothetical protein n=1 Tax=Lysinibacillus sp. NPDC097195 TaxID=3364141 RepID=UPI003801080B